MIFWEVLIQSLTFLFPHHVTGHSGQSLFIQHWSRSSGLGRQPAPSARPGSDMLGPATSVALGLSSPTYLRQWNKLSLTTCQNAWTLILLLFVIIRDDLFHDYGFWIPVNFMSLKKFFFLKYLFFNSVMCLNITLCILKMKIKSWAFLCDY